jgi:hypothetical protein
VIRWRRSVLLTAALALTWAGAPGARADDDRLLDPGDAVAGHPGMDYLALLKLALPTLALSPDDHRIEAGAPSPGPRNLAGDAYQGDPPDLLVMGAIEDRRIRVGGKPRIVLLADFGRDKDRDQDYALLILMTDEATPRVLDMADVGVNKDTFFANQDSFVAPSSVLPLSPGDTALVTHSERDDEDLTVDDFELIATMGDHFDLINRVRLASEHVCGWDGSQTVKYATRRDAARRFRRLDLTVRSVFTHPPGECGPGRTPPAGAHTYRASFRWDAAHGRFEGRTDELKRLESTNIRLFG